MKLRARFSPRVVAWVGVLSLGGLVPVWYYLPMPVESLDSLTYCLCGYSDVRFNDGKITMVKHWHPSVKPGQQIGTYRVTGNQIEIDIPAKGKVYHETYVRDHIGVLNPPGARAQYRYRAIDKKSSKTFICLGLARLGDEITGWWKQM